MVPDIEREWIAEELRSKPRPPYRLLGLIFLVAGIVWALWRGLG